jgi:hypothetical protein
MSEPASRRSLAWWVRWLHTYVSMLGFTSLLFFAVTGFTLNHVEWLEAAESVSESQGQLAPNLLRPEVDKLAVVELLRQRHRLTGAVHDFVVDDAQCVIVFKEPGRAADVNIEREAGTYTLAETKRGLVAILDDLHKGRDSGAVWSWFIDISAGVLAIAGATGLWLLLYLKKRRGQGLLWAVIGTVVPVALYFIWVP